MRERPTVNPDEVSVVPEDTTAAVAWEPKRRRRRIGDRKDGRRVRGIHPMQFMIPFLMKTRSDAQNHFEDELDITNIEQYLQKKREEGYADIGFLHLFLAAYVRAIAHRPAINRFVAGQHVFARPDVIVAMPVKKEMSITSPDTIIKIHFDQRDTAVQVFEKFDIPIVSYIWFFDCEYYQNKEEITKKVKDYSKNKSDLKMRKLL